MHADGLYTAPGMKFTDNFDPRAAIPSFAASSMARTRQVWSKMYRFSSVTRPRTCPADMPFAPRTSAS